jgi:hypothetical protein
VPSSNARSALLDGLAPPAPPSTEQKPKEVAERVGFVPVGIPRGIGELLDGLADDLELANDRILAHPLGHKSVAAYRRVFFDVVDCVADVTEIDALLHRGAILPGCGREATGADSRRSTHRPGGRAVLRDPDQVPRHQRTVRVHVDQQIDVAVRTVPATCDRAEHSDIACTVLSRPVGCRDFLPKIHGVVVILIVDAQALMEVIRRAPLKNHALHVENPRGHLSS